MIFAIFGANGFLGKNLVRYLEDNGQVVIPIMRNNAVKNGFNLDITNYDDFAQLSDEKIDIIINCASALPDIKSLTEPNKLLNFYNTNVIGGANIANWASFKGIRKIINCSSLSVINKPWPCPLTEIANTYPGGQHVGYSTSKLAQELVMNEIAQQKNIQVIHLRLSALYGIGMKWEGIIAKLISDMGKDLPINLTNGNKMYFNFLHIQDLCKIMLKISEADKCKTGAYNVGSDEEVSLFSLASIIKANINSSSIISNVDVNDSISHAQIDISKLENLINCNKILFKPIQSGIKELIADYKKFRIV